MADAAEEPNNKLQAKSRTTNCSRRAEQQTAAQRPNNTLQPTLLGLGRAECDGEARVNSTSSCFARRTRRASLRKVHSAMLKGAELIPVHGFRSGLRPRCIFIGTTPVQSSAPQQRARSSSKFQFPRSPRAPASPIHKATLVAPRDHQRDPRHAHPPVRSL